MKRILATFAIASFAFTGCSSTEEKGITLMEDLANIVESNKEDCDKMGEALKAKIDSNKGLLEDLNKLGKDSEKKISEEQKTRLMGASMKMMGGMMKCQANEKVKGAMASMK